MCSLVTGGSYSNAGRLRTALSAEAVYAVLGGGLHGRVGDVGAGLLAGLCLRRWQSGRACLPESLCSAVQ